MSKQTFKQRSFRVLLAVAIVPVTVGLLTTGLALREVLAGAGTAGPWSVVGESGGRLLEQVEPYSVTNPELARAAEEHRSNLSESVQFSRIYTAVLQRFVRLLPLLALAVGILIIVLATAAARRLARAMSRPVEELAGWSELIATGEPLPGDSPTREREVVEITLLRDSLRTMAADLEEGRRRELEAARLRSWSSMARRVAHEIKNPLTPMRLAATQVAHSNDPDSRAAADVLLEEIARLDGMARSFAQLGHLPEGPPSEIDLTEMLEGMARIHSTPEIRVTVEAGEETPTMIGHHEALERVFRNLVANALEAMEGSGQHGVIRIRVRPEDSHGEGTPEGSEPEGVGIIVEDEGPGLPFELEGDNWLPEFTTKRRGTGLGLTLVRRNVEVHGGWVQAGSAPGGGARFHVHLPLSPPPRANPVP
jgi:nitrogen fixation/metabolism regulation signal transduction histidine kinase